MTWDEMNKDDRLIAITAQINDGMTGAQMAQKLKTTRSAVLGFCRRNGLKLKSRYTTSQKEARKEGKAKPKRTKEITPQCPPESKIVESDIDEYPVPTDIPSCADPVPFIEAISRGLCKWPLWDDFEGPDISMCCGGERIEGRPYCRSHEDLHRGIGTPGERSADRVLEKYA